MRPAFKLLLWALPLLGLWLSAPPARGQRPDSDAVERVERLHVEGAALYRAGRYRPAIAKFTEAYRVFPEPNLLYNTARCHEALGEVDRAIATYERFLSHGDADAAVKRRAKTKLELLRRARRHSLPATAQPGGTSVDPAPSRPKRSAGLRVAKWALLGMSVAAAAGGTVAFALGARDHRRVDDAIDDADGDIVSMTRAEAVELTDSGNTKKWIGVGLWSAAGAALVASAVLFLLDGRGEAGRVPAEHRGLNVALTPSSGGGALWIGTRF